MLNTAKILAALEQKRALFHQVDPIIQARLVTLQQALLDWNHRSSAELGAAVADIAWPGALPTLEHDTQPLVIPFEPQWANHHQARQWALTILKNVTTFAADGSQISATRDLSIPVGLIQIGWFENRHQHTHSGSFEKDVQVEVLAPSELAGSESGLADSEVEWRRFQGEAAQVERFMQAYAHHPDHVLAFFDGSLIISFVQHMPPQRQKDYLDQIKHLLNVSEVTQVPLLAFVDASYADDVGSLFAYLGGLGDRAPIRDAELFRPFMKGWGSRTRLYRCARADRVVAPGDQKYYQRVLITYLQTSAEGPPARLELPDWLLATGRHEWVFDVVRAECIVGLGYPYTLETADAVAVLTGQDRERFFGLFQQFAAQEKLPLRFSRKSISKRRRR